MSTTSNLSLTLGFADELSKTVTIEDVPQASISAIKGKIKQINANTGGQYDALYQLFVSSEGEAFSKIIAAKLVTYQEEVIYNG